MDRLTDDGANKVFRTDEFNYFLLDYGKAELGRSVLLIVTQTGVPRQTCYDWIRSFRENQKVPKAITTTSLRITRPTLRTTTCRSIPPQYKGSYSQILVLS